MPVYPLGGVVGQRLIRIVLYCIVLYCINELINVTFGPSGFQGHVTKMFLKNVAKRFNCQENFVRKELS